MEPEEKRLLRTVVKKVHPDLFTNHPKESACNSESLKLLNSYLDSVSNGEVVEETRLEFWVALGPQDQRVPIRAELPAWGSLGPLFYAFDLINEEQLLAGVGRCKKGANDTDVLSWLELSVDQAARAADEHEAVRGKIRELQAGLEDEFKLAAVQVGGEYSVSLLEQRRQIEALQTLETCLMALSAQQPEVFEGLSIRVYHPDSDNLENMSFLNPDGTYNLRGSLHKSYVGEDGTLHVVADRGTIQAAVADLDLERARLLTQVACFWVRRSRDMTAAVRDLLKVERVWCDTRTEHASQKFVLWAGQVFKQRRKFYEALRGQKFRFSLLLHCDQTAPPVDFMATSSVLQVRADTPPEQLMQFMTGSIGMAADEAAADAAAAKAEEEALLEQVKQVLGVRHIIRVCPSSQHGEVAAAARRLLEHAEAIRHSGIDLSGASLAIDDCYEVWESGFISIPHNFRLQDLQPKLRRLLAAAPSQQAQETTGHVQQQQQQLSRHSAKEASPRTDQAGEGMLDQLLPTAEEHESRWGPQPEDGAGLSPGSSTIGAQLQSTTNPANWPGHGPWAGQRAAAPVIAQAAQHRLTHLESLRSRSHMQSGGKTSSFGLSGIMQRPTMPLSVAWRL